MRRAGDAHTFAAGIRVPQPIGDFLILRAVRESKGFAIAVTDEKISAARNEVAREEGLLLCPEGATTYAAYRQGLADGRVTKRDRVVLFNCATGLKYPLPPVTRTLDRFAPIVRGLVIKALNFFCSAAWWISSRKKFWTKKLLAASWYRARLQFYVVDPISVEHSTVRARQHASHCAGSREKKMKKSILTIAGSALITLSAVQFAAASEHQDRVHHRTHTSAQYRDTNASVPAQPEWSGYSYSGGISAPAGHWSWPGLLKQDF
jgi:hypothetical protein